MPDTPGTSAYSVSDETFIVPLGAETMAVYVPRKGLVVQVNAVAAALLRSVCRGRTAGFSQSELDVLAELVDCGVLNAAAGIDLAVHAGQPFQPTCVTLFLTNACNLRCVYCYANGGSDPDLRTIPFEAAAAGIDWAADNAVAAGEDTFCVNFHGAGEPTLEWDLYRSLVAYSREAARRRGIRCNLTTCTNGVLREERAAWIAGNTDYASLSLDGLADVQDRLRPKADGSGSFETIRRTLRIFDSRNLDYIIRGTVCQGTAARLPAFVQWLCEECDPDSIQFEPMLVDGRCFTSGCSEPGEAEFVNAFSDASGIAAAHGRTIGFSTLSLDELRTFYCCVEFEGFTVTHDGLLTSCFGVCERRHAHADDFIYGRFDPDRGGFEIDEARIQLLRSRHTGPGGNLPGCDRCFCKYLCCGDCALNSLRKGRGLFRGTRCRMTRAVAANLIRDVLHIPRATYSELGEGELPAGYDDSVGSFVAASESGEPRILKIVRFAVRESHYMRPPPRDTALSRLLNKAILQAKRGRLNRALAAYNMILEHDEDHLAALVNSAPLLIRLGQASEALDRARRAAGLAPDAGEAHSALGRVLAVCDRLGEAKEAFREALRLEPLSGAARFNLAWLEFTAGNPNAARRLLAAADTATSASGGGDVARLLRLCEGEASGELTDEAADGWGRELSRMLQSSLAARWDESQVAEFARLADLVAGERYADALGELDTTAFRDDCPLVCHWLSGMVHTRLGRVEAADAALAEAVALMPRLHLQPARTEWRLYTDGWSCRIEEGRAVALSPGRHRWAVEAVGTPAHGARTLEGVAELEMGREYVVGLSGFGVLDRGSNR